MSSIMEESSGQTDSIGASDSQRVPEEALLKESIALLSAQEELQLQQLTQAKYWQEKRQSIQQVDKKVQGKEVTSIVTQIPNEWELTKGIILHDWQQQCVDAWFDNGKRGVIKVVTGAGKTILALAIAERLQRS